MPKDNEAQLKAAEIFAKIKKQREVHWYALRVSSQHERKIADMLGEKGIETFVPLRKEKHRWSDRMKVVEVVLTPGVIFVRNSMEKKNDVFITREVKAYVHEPGCTKPAAIADDNMHDFMRVCDANCDLKIVLPSVGDDVMVMEGPMRGVVGQLVKTEGEDKLVIKLNDVFAASIKINALSVCKVPKGTKSLPAEHVPNKM